MSKPIDRSTLPRLEDLPIPADVKPGKGWTPQMVEMAAHIGPFNTLRIIDAYGGQRIYIPRDPERNPFRDLIGPAQAEKISFVYGTEHLLLPRAREALDRARRGGVLALVRRQELSQREAAVILGTTRTYLVHLLAQPDEDGEPVAALRRAPRHDPRQVNIFDFLEDVPGFGER